VYPRKHVTITATIKATVLSKYICLNWFVKYVLEPNSILSTRYRGRIGLFCVTGKRIQGLPKLYGRFAGSAYFIKLMYILTLDSHNIILLKYIISFNKQIKIIIKKIVCWHSGKIF